MKIQFLGTAAFEGIPALFCECEVCRRSRELGGKNIRTRSQALIDDRLPVDFPADTYYHFIKFNLPMLDIKSCIITHSHGDHLQPGDFLIRRPGFGVVKNREPLTIYSGKSGYEMIKKATESATEEYIKIEMFEEFNPFIADGYNVTPLKASHDPESDPVIFLIEKDGKSILYGNDTGEIYPEVWEELKKLKKPINLISLDCTMGTLDSDYYGHFSLDRCADVRKRFLEEGLADENTIFLVNHFSHNGGEIVYDDFVKIAGEKGFLVTYDGMIVEF